jgi:AcrR family transcriptional regulator
LTTDRLVGYAGFMCAKAALNARDRILTSAQEILLEEGPGGLSVDRLIDRAGLSKGGFFHHFKTKDDLLLALLEAYVPRFEARIEEAAARDPEPRGRYLRAYLDTVFGEDGEDRRQAIAFARALFLSQAEAPRTIGRYRELNMQHFRRVFAGLEGADTDAAAALNVALDGLWLGEALGIYDFRPDERAKVIEGLRRLSRSC